MLEAGWTVTAKLADIVIDYKPRSSFTFRVNFVVIIRRVP